MKKIKKFADLTGLNLVKITGVHKGSEQVTITVVDDTNNEARIFTLSHRQDCCESVELHDVEDGDADDLADSRIIEAYESTNEEAPPLDEDEWHDSSHTWTFYRLLTTKGPLVFRWLGQSNGYYSEDVNFHELND